jgi:hypothetical protein
MTARHGSNDLEIAGELPVGDRLARLALLPFAGGGVVIDEFAAEQRPRGVRALQSLRRFPERRGQRAPGARLMLVGVADDRLVRLLLVLDAPEAGADRRGQRHIRVYVRGPDPIFDPLRFL